MRASLVSTLLLLLLAGAVLARARLWPKAEVVERRLQEVQNDCGTFDWDQEEWSIRVVRCRPARKPATYGPIFSLENVCMKPCGKLPMSQLVGTNSQVTSISFLSLTASAEVVTLVEKGGPVYQLNVVSEGNDEARWMVTLPPVRSFRGNSCLDFTQFCEVASVMPLMTSFVVVDRHRLQEFNISWSDSESLTLELATLGKMNMEAPILGEAQLYFPSYMAQYKALNHSFISDALEITPLFPHARDRYWFVSDTGNHRVMFINATGPTLQYIESYGATGEVRTNQSGFNYPMGVAVMAHTDESFFGPVMAAVFVCDRRNHRLVKLLLGYRKDPSLAMNRGERPTLMWGGEYYKDLNGVNYNMSLYDPVGVSIYRHFIFVCEAEGNAITVLTTNYVQHDELLFVTELYPLTNPFNPKMQLTGSFSATEQGYLWFAYIERPSTHGLGSIILPEPLVQSPPASWIEEFRAQCTNATIYNMFIMANASLYDEHVIYVLSAARINWRFPYLPGYLSKDSFNLTLMFDLMLWNETVLEGNMFYCLPPPPETTPPMLSANEDGWNTPGGGGVLLTGSSICPGLAKSLAIVIIGLLWQRS